MIACLRFFLCGILVLYCGLCPALAVTVAQDGTGDYTTVQAAINAAPSGQTSPYLIYVKNGVYREVVSIPSGKTFIHLIGESVAHTIITYDNYSGKEMPGGGTFGTSNSATVTVNATDFFAANITFSNTTGDAPQALAINVNADRCAFSNCRFLGGQDTLLTNGSGNRQYFRNCYIDGVVDFIFGGAAALFDSCVIYPKTRIASQSASYITAANTQAGSAYGYVFRDCRVLHNRGVTTYYLGRPWQNASGSATMAHNKVVWLHCTFGASIRPEGWAVWNTGTDTSLITYAEYLSRDFAGNLVDTSQRVSWSHQLPAAVASGYTRAAIFGAWNPCAVHTMLCDPIRAELAVSNLRAVQTSTQATLTWNASWPLSGVTYELYRSSDRLNFTRVQELISVNDTNINFGVTEALPPAGSMYYYYVRAVLPGYTTHITDTVVVSRLSAVTVSDTTGFFEQEIGLPSADQAYYVSGTNLIAGITMRITGPFEYSADGGNSWLRNTDSVVLPQYNNAVGATQIRVRLNAVDVGPWQGRMIHRSGSAVREISLEGRTSWKLSVPDARYRQAVFFPNPAGDRLTVAHPLADATYRISVVAADGRVLSDCMAAPHTRQTQIDLRSVPPGIYRLIVRAEDGFLTGSFLRY